MHKSAPTQTLAKNLKIIFLVRYFLIWIMVNKKCIFVFLILIPRWSSPSEFYYLFHRCTWPDFPCYQKSWSTTCKFASAVYQTFPSRYSLFKVELDLKFATSCWSVAKSKELDYCKTVTVSMPGKTPTFVTFEPKSHISRSAKCGTQLTELSFVNSFHRTNSLLSILPVLCLSKTSSFFAILQNRCDRLASSTGNSSWHFRQQIRAARLLPQPPSHSLT